VPHDPLTAEQREIRELVRTIARERIAPRAAEIDRTAEFPWDVVELFRENGIFGTLADEEYGGVGASALMTFVSIEEISKACATSGLILAVQALGSLAFELAGTDEQRRRFLPRIASGESLSAYALTEPGSGSDAAAMRTEARREGEEYVLDGSKRFITNAGVAELYICFAKTDPEGGHLGVSAFVVEASTPGLEIGRIEPKMGIKGSTTCEVFLSGCRVPVENRIGAEGEGFRLAMRILDRSRPGIAAQALGLAQGATDYAVEYARRRETMGEPIARHQLIAGMLAEMETRCEAARELLHRCGRLIDDGVEGAGLTKLSAMTKLFCTDTAMAVTTDAVQVLGGYGYMQEHPVELSHRDLELFPDDGITKGDLFDYYAAVAPVIVPLCDRPFTIGCAVCRTGCRAT
jgi:alkylation response protein AidB-like acyl-CoA dehydrogenase